MMPRQFSISLLRFALIAIAPAAFLAVWLAAGGGAFTWDSGWYRSVVNNGYMFNGDITQQQNVAFLPGYPLLIAALHRLSPLGVVTAQQVVCLVGYLVGAWCFVRHFEERYGRPQAWTTIVLWTLMPFSIYFMNGYSESIFFATCGLFFLLADRGHLRLACLALSWGLITRPYALALLPVLGWIVLQRERHAHADIRIAGLRSIAGLLQLAPWVLIFPIAFTAYHYVNFGDSMLYSNALHAWSAPEDPLTTKLLSIAMASATALWRFATEGSLPDPQQLAAGLFVLNVGCTALLLAMGRTEAFLFNAGVLGFWLLTADLANLGRHIAIMTAIPMTLSMLAVPVLCSTAGAQRPAPPLPSRIGAAFLLLACGAIGAFHFLRYSSMYLATQWVS